MAFLREVSLGNVSTTSREWWQPFADWFSAALASHCVMVSSLRLYWKVFSGLKTIQLTTDRFRHTGACGPQRTAWQLPERVEAVSCTSLLFLRLGKALSWRSCSSLLPTSCFCFPVIAPFLSFLFLDLFSSSWMHVKISRSSSERIMPSAHVCHFCD